MIGLKPCVFRFSDVEVREAELRVTRAGEPLALEPKTYRVLVYFLHNPGHLVTKNELLDAAWGDTAVTESSLTRAIALLRRALEDDPRQPRFIETVSTAGYRFICPMVAEEESPGTVVAVPAASVNSAPIQLPAIRPVANSATLTMVAGTGRRFWPIMGGAAILLIASAGAFLHLHHPLLPPRITSYVQLTNDGLFKEIIGTDGNNLYLNLYMPAGHATLPVSGGRLTELPIDLPTTRDSPRDNPNLLSLSSDGSALLVGSNWDWKMGWNLWVVGAHGSTAHYLAKGEIGAWSPDGKTVVYMTRRGDLYTVPAEGGESRLLYTSPTPKDELRWAGDITWSPDGGKIRFVRWGRYWEISADGTNAHEVLPGWPASNPKTLMWSGRWSPDGEFFFFTAASMAYSPNSAAKPQIWALDERRGRLRKPNPEPVQLTTGATSWGAEGIAISRDGRRVYAPGVNWRGELLAYDARSKALTPYLGGISAEFVDFSRDGKYLVYVTYPDGIMWRANRDGTGLMQLTGSPLGVSSPRWSPDGTQIVLVGQLPFEFTKIYTISSQGGTPKRLLPGDADWESDPDWSPDGKKVVFTQASAGGPSRSRILEVATGRITDLPSGPRDAYGLRWSSDDNIVGSAGQDLALFDTRRNKWSSISPLPGALNCSAPKWSRDGRFIYFESIDGDQFKVSDPGLYRIPVTGGKPEKVVDLKGFASTYGPWYGLDPDDNPLLLRNAGSREIYALTLER